MDNENTNPIEGQSQEVKTFTQDDVNRIVGDRLAKEKSKSDQAFAQREQELSKRELSLTAKEILSSKGLPPEILEALNYSDEESLNKSISIIEQQIKKEEPPTLSGREPAKSYVANGKLRGMDPFRKAMGLL